MSGINGVGGIPEPRHERPAKTQPSQSAKADSSAPKNDDVVISSTAQAAAQVIQATETIPDVRADRVEAAKAAIARGDYKNPDIVANVAQGVDKLL